MKWLHNVIHDLDQLAGLPPTPKLIAAAFLMCCAHHVLCKPVNEISNVALLKMMALQSNGEGFKCLVSFMKERSSQ